MNGGHGGCERILCSNETRGSLYGGSAICALESPENHQKSMQQPFGQAMPSRCSPLDAVCQHGENQENALVLGEQLGKAWWHRRATNLPPRPAGCCWLLIMCARHGALTAHRATPWAVRLAVSLAARGGGPPQTSRSAAPAAPLADPRPSLSLQMPSQRSGGAGTGARRCRQLPLPRYSREPATAGQLGHWPGSGVMPGCSEHRASAGVQPAPCRNAPHRWWGESGSQGHLRVGPPVTHQSSTPPAATPSTHILNGHGQGGGAPTAFALTA